jgi:LPS sulfotransferase NodH
MDLPLSQRYVILSTPRSGSSHLVEALEAHPHVACLGEIFNLHGGAMRKLGILSKRPLDKASNEPLDYLEELMEAWTERPQAKPVFGFKMMLHHDPRVIDHLVADPGWKMILLRRENVLAQWSSLQLAKITGEWGSKGKKKRAAQGIAEPEPPPIEFKSRVFEAYCDRLDARYDSIKRRVAKHALFEVTTETIDARRDEILDFLGVDSRLAPPAPGRGERQNTTSLEERFTNSDEVLSYALTHGLQMDEVRKTETRSQAH